jgi:hypothetical protein
MADLTILKVRDDIGDNMRFSSLDPTLPKPPFRFLINAPSGSGKTNMIQNLLFNDNFYRGMFDRVIYLSPTVFEDKTLQHMRRMAEDSRNNLIISDQVERLGDLIQNLIESQMGGEDHVLLVLDDCIGLIPKGSPINTFIMKARHYRISIIMVTQYYRGIDPKIRENSNAYIFYANANLTEVRKIEDEIGNNFKDFKKYYQLATEQPYNFLFVHGHKLYHNFTDLLYVKGS